MKSSTAQTSGALLGTVLLVGTGVSAIASESLHVSYEPQPSSVAAAQDTHEAVASDVVNVANVEGSFAFDQNTVSSNSYIADVFNKAASSLCASMPDYNVKQAGQIITVDGMVDRSFEATVDDMTADEGAVALILACACSSNLAGGGAIANAEVSGVSLESIAQMAGA